MAIFFDGPVGPDALTTFVRNVPTDSGLGLLALFPVRFFSTNTIDFAEIVRTNRTARYRTYDGRLHVSERDIGTEKRVKMPPLSSSLAMGELERLQLEFARTGGTNQQALAQAVYNDAETLTREVQARLEQAWGDVLSDGILSINENGYIDTADFGVPAAHKVAPSVLWSNTATATVLSDLIAWADTYKASNGAAPATILTSNRVVRLMQRNAEVVAAVAGTNTGRTRVTLNELNDLLSSEGLPTLRPTYESSVDVDGTSTRVLADDRLLFLPENLGELGFTAYGLSATALELVNSNVAELSFQNAPGIVGVIEKTGPPYRQATYVDAVAMPILGNSRRLLVADVA